MNQNQSDYVASDSHEYANRSHFHRRAQPETDNFVDNSGTSNPLTPHDHSLIINPEPEPALENLMPTISEKQVESVLIQNMQQLH